MLTDFLAMPGGPAILGVIVLGFMAVILGLAWLIWQDTNNRDDR